MFTIEIEDGRKVERKIAKLTKRKDCQKSARIKKMLEILFYFANLKHFSSILLKGPALPVEIFFCVHREFQPNRCSRLAVIRNIYIYKRLFLLHRCSMINGE